jgi:hypothetical protein
MSRTHFLLTLLGAASTLGYLAAYSLGDLRKNTIGFVVVFFAIFLLYLAACALALRTADDAPLHTNYFLLITIFFAFLPRLLLLPTHPTLSDDMYRYVWDGRVQGHGLSPYLYPPDAKEVAELRSGDTTVWKYINRKPFVTVYPPGAQLAFAAIWRIAGDSATGFKTAFVLAELAGALLLVQLLRALNQPAARVLIYLWSPLLIFEVAHAGHVDGLMLPLLILAFWARVRERPWLVGAALGMATLVKLFPLILLPALLPVGQASSLSYKIRPALKTLLAFGLTLALGYLPYLLSGSTLGFLPNYFNENFNMGLARLLFDFARANGLSGATLANAFTFGGLAGLSILFLLKPAATPESALRRCVWLIGWFTLFTQNLFSWYLLWLLPLIVLFVEPGKLFGFNLAPTTAWLIFSGAIIFSYVFFVRWRVNDAAQIAEFAPLFILLLLSGLKQLKAARLWRRVKAAGRSAALAS